MSPKRKNIQIITIEELSTEKLPGNLDKAINQIEFEIWEKVEPGFKIVIDKSEINAWLRVKIPLNKFLATIAGLAGSIWAIIKVIIWLLPILETYYNTSHPLQ